jgi:hypothetical protein
MTEYRIEYAIQRCDSFGEEFVEIGFGSSGSCSDLDGCTFSIESQVNNGIWETEKGQPDPADVMRAIQIESEGG